MTSSAPSEHFRTLLFIIITGIGGTSMGDGIQLLDKLVAGFLINTAHVNHSLHAYHAYETDIAQLCVYHKRLSLYVEDLDLSLDSEHLTVVGKSGEKRTSPLEDPRLVQQLRAYLKRIGYKHALLFRAEKNGRGGPRYYQSVQERWDHYCAQAEVDCTLHQLRHTTRATQLINDGISLPAIRKHLGKRTCKLPYTMSNSRMKRLK